MCLAVPMRLTEVHANGKGVAELDGSRQTVDLSLVSDVQLGDYVIIHAGFAIEKLDQNEADATLALFEELVRGVHPEPQPLTPGPL